MTQRESTHLGSKCKVDILAILCFILPSCMVNFHTRALTSQTLPLSSWDQFHLRTRDVPVKIGLLINSVPSFIWCRLIFLFRQGYIVAKFP